MTKTDTGDTGPGKTGTNQEKRAPTGLKRVIMVDGMLVELTPAEPTKEWGLLDTSNGTWFGNDIGPFRFTDHDLARVERQVLAARIPCDPLRISVEPFTSATKKLDDITPENTFDQAIDLIEKRGY